LKQKPIFTKKVVFFRGPSPEGGMELDDFCYQYLELHPWSATHLGEMETTSGQLLCVSRKPECSPVHRICTVLGGLASLAGYYLEVEPTTYGGVISIFVKPRTDYERSAYKIRRLPMSKPLRHS